MQFFVILENLIFDHIEGVHFSHLFLETVKWNQARGTNKKTSWHLRSHKVFIEDALQGTA